MVSIKLSTIVIVSMIAFLLQFIINGPLFAKFYMKLAGKTEAPTLISKLPLRLVLNFLANIFIAYGVATIYLFAAMPPYLGGHSVWNGIFCGIFVWLVFLVPASSVDVIWNQKLAKLWLFEIAASFIVLGTMGMFVALLK
jgi:hypothetical protein